MKTLLRLLVSMAMKQQVSDIHMTRFDHGLQVALRKDDGLVFLKQDLFTLEFFEAVKFEAGLDLCAPFRPQSGEFEVDACGQRVSCRFSLLKNKELECGVIRLLPCRFGFHLSDLTHHPRPGQLFQQMITADHGLIIACGPTGSGKSTTIHALLHERLAQNTCRIVTLEDPVEIPEPEMIQIDVSEQGGLDYDTAIAQLLRLDPDIIFFGECRTPYAAQMALRAALTGHLVFTTLHAGSGAECLFRLLDLGVDKDALQSVLKGVFVCDLIPVPQENRKECLYEIWKEESLADLFAHPNAAFPSLGFEEQKHHRR